MSKSQIVHQSYLHWIIFFWPIVLMSASIYLAMTYELIYTPALIVAFIGLAWFLVIWMSYQFSSLTIKNRQVILRTGFFVRETIDIPLNKIESIDIRQSLLGALLKYGNLVITGTGGTKQFINNIQAPLTCRRCIEQLMHGHD